jgi:hypothetical protein
MATKMHELLRKLREDTANELSELQQSEEIGSSLDEQSEPTAVCCGRDPATVVHFLEQELSNGGLSLKTH